MPETRFVSEMRPHPSTMDSPALPTTTASLCLAFRRLASQAPPQLERTAPRARSAPPRSALISSAFPLSLKARSASSPFSSAPTPSPASSQYTQLAMVTYAPPYYGERPAPFTPSALQGYTATPPARVHCQRASLASPTNGVPQATVSPTPAPLQLRQDRLAPRMWNAVSPRSVTSLSCARPKERSQLAAQKLENALLECARIRFAPS